MTFPPKNYAQNVTQTADIMCASFPQPLPKNIKRLFTVINKLSLQYMKKKEISVIAHNTTNSSTRNSM